MIDAGSGRALRLAVTGLLLALAWSGPARAQAAAPNPFGALPGAKEAKPETPPDLAFGAFQRGYFGTALQEATKRIGQNPQDGAAMTLIGEIYDQGLAVKKDPEEAAHWYKLASERRNREGTFAYAMALMNGQGVAKDPAAAKTYFETAAAQGHAGALYNLGVLALQSGTAPPGGGETASPPGRDYASAYAFFTKAADAGDLDAMFAKATLIQAGEGAPKDLAGAAALFKAAADQKHPGAELEYGIMAFNGEGVPKDEAAAAHYFQLAAAQGNPVAANRLARLYAAGRGTDKNLLEAARWHLLARAKGVADTWLDTIVTQLTPADRVKLEASLRKTLGQ